MFAVSKIRKFFNYYYYFFFNIILSHMSAYNLDDIENLKKPSFWKDHKKLITEEVSFDNRLRSIREDAESVQAFLRNECPGLPAFANVRCGRWYLPPDTETCYFMSKDGHNHNWAFSQRRTNINVVHAAASSKGAVIVDSTRRGKQFPDSFSKTVPIWMCVINRSVVRYRHLHAIESPPPQPLSSSAPISSPNPVPTCSSTTRYATGIAPPPPGAPTSASAGATLCFQELRLPPWVLPSERDQIAAKLDGWVDEYTALGSGLAAIAQCLHAPLVPVWAHRAIGELSWRVTHASDSPGADAVAASLRERGGGGSGGDSCGGGGCVPVYLASASLCERDRERRGWYYVQGAGDDEENWAGGLTPVE
jgi:tRNA A64-2'-O-ribosylphosphate transferase